MSFLQGCRTLCFFFRPRFRREVPIGLQVELVELLGREVFLAGETTFVRNLGLHKRRLGAFPGIMGILLE